LKEKQRCILFSQQSRKKTGKSKKTKGEVKKYLIALKLVFIFVESLENV